MNSVSLKTNDLGIFITRMRRITGLTQDELADRIGAPRAYVSQIETGTKRWPAKYIPRIADALGCTVEELESVASGNPMLTSPTHGLSANDIERIADAIAQRLTEERVPA